MAELAAAAGLAGMVGGWVWHAASLATQIRQVLASVDRLQGDLRTHVSDENETFERIHERLNDHHAGLARIEGRLQRNGLDR